MIALMVMGSELSAFGTLQLTLAASDGSMTNIVDNSTGDGNTTTGKIGFSGAVGKDWTLNVDIATSKPITGSASAPYLDINTRDITTQNSNATLLIIVTDTDFTNNPPVSFKAAIGGTTTLGSAADGSVEFQAWASGLNQPTLETTIIADLGPFYGPSFGSNAVVNLNPGGPPYS